MGTRELKSRLSEYLRRVKAGQTIVVTERGKVIGHIKLCGYDSFHLAAAWLWQEKLALPVTLATFDRDLWLAGRLAGVEVWPEGLL